MCRELAPHHWENIMSIYACLACKDCRVSLWLGKIVNRHDEKNRYFAMNNPGDLPNPEQKDLNRAVWRMLSNHMGHTLRVISEETDEYEEVCNYQEIGGDEIGDINFEDYLKDWPE